MIVHFSSAVDSASGVILDIDFTEAFTIQARGIMDSVLVDTTITAGSPGTGDGLATPWAFRRAQPDVYSIKFIGTRASGLFGLGFDNFVTCALGRPNATRNMARPPIILFPNPSSGRLTARSPQARIRSLAVFDATGRLLEPVLRCDAHEVSLQLHHHGLALVEIVTDRGVVVRKVFFE